MDCLTTSIHSIYVATKDCDEIEQGQHLAEDNHFSAVELSCKGFALFARSPEEELINHTGATRVSQHLHNLAPEDFDETCGTKTAYRS